MDDFSLSFQEKSLAPCFHACRSTFPDAEVTLPILMGMQKLYRIEEQLRCSKAPPD